MDHSVEGHYAVRRQKYRSLPSDTISGRLRRDADVYFVRDLAEETVRERPALKLRVIDLLPRPAPAIASLSQNTGSGTAVHTGSDRGPAWSASE
ncbi:unnamed protein product [Haemonchus placei]|uniref:USP domain-containing protein n=1 Tax=Haemonchus placei TaxID=6290 RepID=A0A0N4WK56_HAEPC|nr:unnamed protein product [Haemonchus placei]